MMKGTEKQNVKEKKRKIDEHNGYTRDRQTEKVYTKRDKERQSYKVKEIQCKCLQNLPKKKRQNNITDIERERER